MISAGAYFLIIFQLLKWKTLNLKYTLLWLVSVAIMLALAVFPQILTCFAALVGIYEPINALFAFVFFCMIIILMSITAIMSKLNEKNKRLIQPATILEK